MTLKNFGGRVAHVWEGLRPATRHLVESALQRSTATGAVTARGTATSAPYDPRSDWELSRLLSALDERAREASADDLSAEQVDELSHLSETCASVLQGEARSAEIFGQLLERALRSRDFKRIDTLADTISARLAPSEMCELARHANSSVRAIAREALAQVPTGALVELLGDPVDAEIARGALESQAEEYGSPEACWIVNALDRADEEEV